MGAERALRRFASVPLHHIWFANTDADTVVPADWLVCHLRWAEAGAAAVAGVVEVDSFADHPPEVPGRFSARYDGPPDRPHPHVHGANLGVRADAYRAAGGWRQLPIGEDHALWAALARTGHRVVSSRASKVTTSGRAVGRLRGGFADVLNELAS